MMSNLISLLVGWSRQLLSDGIFPLAKFSSNSIQLHIETRKTLGDESLEVLLTYQLDLTINHLIFRGSTKNPVQVRVDHLWNCCA